MKLGTKGEALVKYFESCTLTAYPDPASPLGKMCTSKKIKLTDFKKLQYLDSAGKAKTWKDLKGDPWTIGFGQTGKKNIDGVSVIIGPDTVIDQATADTWFEEEAEERSKLIKPLIKVDVNQDQFDALYSFAYNLGVGNLSSSTLLRKLNAKDFVGAAAEFPKWCKAGGVVLNGLVKRRQAEQALFLGKDWTKFK